jgi:regulator of protease activity HflC (stomatin/prohibitin superfamily)
MEISIVEVIIGFGIYFFIRCILFGFYTVDQNERAVKTIFGRADRLNDKTTSITELGQLLNEDEKKRYNFPLVRVIGPGLHFKMPWEKIYKASVATETVNMALDFESLSANGGGELLEAVTRDQLNIGLKGQIRYRISEQNLYAVFFGIKSPMVHVMGYFVSVLREKIANYESQEKPKEATVGRVLEIKDSIEADGDSISSGTHISDSVSINDLRKNLREINDTMLHESRSTAARYGIVLEASLITGIEPPVEVESALAAINTAYNNVSSEISLAKASADQTIVLSKRAVEIETLKVQAEVEPLIALANQLTELKKSGPDVLSSFVRNVRMNLFQRAKKVIFEK